MKIFVLDKKHARKFRALYAGDFDRLDNPNVIGLGAIDNSSWPPKACGILVASVIDTSVNIEWLFVDPECRRHDAATELLDKLLTYADRCKADMVFSTFSERNEGAEPFMLDFGFCISFSTGWHDYILRLKDFKPLPVPETPEFALDSFFNATSDELAAFNDSLEKSDVRPGVALPIDPRDYSPLSVCVRKGSEITGILLVKTEAVGGNTEIEFPWVYVRSDSVRAIPSIYCLAVDAIRDVYPDTTKVHLETLNPGMDKTITRLAPTAKFKEIYAAHWQMG